jgi:hypothetical protein
MFQRMYVIIRKLPLCVLLSYIKIYIVCGIYQKSLHSVVIINKTLKTFDIITNYIKFNITQQDTQRKLRDNYVHMSRHVGTVECINK